MSVVCLTILFTWTVYGNIDSVLCVAGSHPAGVPYANITCCVHTHWFYLISSAAFVTSLKFIELQSSLPTYQCIYAGILMLF